MEEQKRKYWNDPVLNEERMVNRMTGRIKNSLSGFLRVCVVALIVAFQMGLLLVLPFLLHQYTVYFYVILEIVSLIVIISLINDMRSPAYKIAWIMLKSIRIPDSSSLIRCSLSEGITRP